MIMSSGKVLLGVLAGVAAGTLVGILFAPAKGSRTRRRISLKGKPYVKGLKEKVNEIFDSITEIFEKLSEEASDIAHKSKDNLDEAEKDVKTF